MKPVNAVIIDDESSARKALKTILNMSFPEINILGEASSPKTGIELLKATNPQLCFLDVEMQTGTGFDVLESLSKIDFKVIFITGHKAEAYRSFRFDAVDYLIKPISIEQLKRALEKYHYLEEAKISMAMASQEPRNATPSVERQIVVPEMDGFLVLETCDIIRLESARNYTKLHLKSGKTLIASKSLKEFEDTLASSGFMRIHRSHLANLSFVSKYTRGRLSEVVMKDGTILPLARERKVEFANRFLGANTEGELAQSISPNK